MLDSATADMNRGQRDRYLSWLKENMPDFVAKGRKEIFDKASSGANQALMTRYKDELEYIEQGDYRALDDLKRRYRSLGLNVW